MKTILIFLFVIFSIVGCSSKEQACNTCDGYKSTYPYTYEYVPMEQLKKK